MKEQNNTDRFRCTDPTDPDATFGGPRACACLAGGLPAPALGSGGITVVLAVLLALAAWGLRPSGNRGT